jgi:hypothetical protein
VKRAGDDEDTTPHTRTDLNEKRAQVFFGTIVEEVDAQVLQGLWEALSADTLGDVEDVCHVQPLECILVLRPDLACQKQVLFDLRDDPPILAHPALWVPATATTAATTVAALVDDLHLVLWVPCQYQRGHEAFL